MNETRTDATTSRVAREARSSPWTAVRYALGILQMVGAATALVLLVVGGVTRAALIVVVLTGLMTTISVVLFGGRR